MTDLDPQALIAELEVVHDLGKKLDAGDGGVWGMAGRAAKLLKQQQDKIAALEAALTEAERDEYDSDELALARLLGSHYLDPKRLDWCICGRWGDGDEGEGWDDHIAAEITDAGYVKATLTPTPASTDARETLLTIADTAVKAAINADTDWAPSEVVVDAILAAFPTLPVTRDDAKAEALEEAADNLVEISDEPASRKIARWLRARAATYRATSQKGDGQ